MAITYSNPFYINVIAAATTLSSAASGLASGGWVRLHSTDQRGLTSALLASNPGTVMGYMDKMKWDPIGRRVLFIGQGHAGDQKFIQYDEATDLWSQLADPYWEVSPATVHGYQHNTIDPATGDFYYRRTNSTQVYKLTRATGQWSQLSTSGLSFSASPLAAGLEFFPEANRIVLAGRSRLALYNPASATWTTVNDDNGTIPMGEIHNIGVYSPQKQVVYFGGGDTPSLSSDLYTINASLTVTKRTNCPVPFGVSQTINTVDPVTGHFLVIKGTAWWRFNPDGAGSWSSGSFTGSMFANANTDQIYDVAACPIPEYGVILFMRDGEVDSWLYKP